MNTSHIFIHKHIQIILLIILPKDLSWEVFIKAVTVYPQILTTVQILIKR